jgi:hypothetical protein
MKKLGLAAVFTFVVASLALAEEINVSITKVDGDGGTITYVKNAGMFGGGKGGKKGGGKKGGGDQAAPEPVTVSVVKAVKIAKGIFKMDEGGDFKKSTYEVGEEIKSGFNDEIFAKANDKGVNARITIAEDGPDKGKVTRVLIIPKNKKDAN